MAVPWDLVLQNPLLAAVLIIGYLHYSMRFGAMATYFDTLDGLVAVVIAIAEEVDGVNEDTVHERFNGGDSNEFLEAEDG